MFVIAHIENDFTEKFAVPRQSGIAEKIGSRIVFEPEFRNADALRGLEEFSHLWLIWEFSEAKRRNKRPTDTEEEFEGGCDWKPTVRPPRLGGNQRLGVFATRSPFRPNPIGLSCVKIERIEMTDNLGPVIHVLGADLMNGTPIYDIKPYIPYADCKPDAVGGFTDTVAKREVEVVFPERFYCHFSQKALEGLIEVLKQDPRPAYQDDPERIYTFTYANKEVSFRCNSNILEVVSIL